jgi:hypothetical protein
MQWMGIWMCHHAITATLLTIFEGFYLQWPLSVLGAIWILLLIATFYLVMPEDIYDGHDISLYRVLLGPGCCYVANYSM